MLHSRIAWNRGLRVRIGVTLLQQWARTLSYGMIRSKNDNLWQNIRNDAKRRMYILKQSHLLSSRQNKTNLWQLLNIENDLRLKQAIILENSSTRVWSQHQSATLVSNSVWSDQPIFMIWKTPRIDTLEWLSASKFLLRRVINWLEGPELHLAWYLTSSSLIACLKELSVTF